MSASANSDTLVEVAFSMLQGGQIDAAEAYAREALKSQPDHLGALNILAVALNAQGRHAKASDVFAELARRQPDQATHWMNLGTALQAQRRREEALAAYARAAALGAASADFFYNVGLVHVDGGNYEAALAVLKDAARLAPQDGEILFQYASCCYETMRLDDAIDALRNWPACRGLTTSLLARIGLLLMNLGELQSASRAIELTSRDSAPDAESALRILQVQERLNQLEAARSGLARLRRDPAAAALGADLLQVEARLADRSGRLEEACRLYRDLLAVTREFHARHQYLFPLAKALDALGRYDEAYATLQEAHRSQLERLALRLPDKVARSGPPFRVVEFGCDPGDVAAWNPSGAPPAAESPIFIVGFPRSGTTLLEQTLDAHPALRSMDETRFMHDVMDEIVDAGFSYPDRLAAIPEGRLAEWRDLYWAKVRRRVELAPGQRLVDKNPLNLLALPAICRLFPNARLVLAVRHPCDVIWSCYLQQFQAPEFTMLCRDLATIAAGYRRAFDFWYRESAVLQPRAHEIRYESLVADFEGEVRQLASFLGLDWTDAMLDPGEHARRKGFISTPSYSQVVQPVNTRAVGRWENYRAHFAPVLPVVRPYLDRWNYAG